MSIERIVRPSHSADLFPSARMEAFSDGVIAVIITIMVLELHVPREPGLQGFLEVLPRLGIYLLSFVMTGIYWLNHHELVRRSEAVSYPVLAANLVWLFALSLVPFFTDYVGEKHFDSFSTAMYEVSMMLAGAGFFLLRWTLLREQRRTHELELRDRSELHKHAVSLFIYLVALPMAYVTHWISLALNVSVTLIWIAPWLGTHRGHRNIVDRTR